MVCFSTNSNNLNKYKLLFLSTKCYLNCLFLWNAR
jgi:hypothetical protein